MPVTIHTSTKTPEAFKSKLIQHAQELFVPERVRNASPCKHWRISRKGLSSSRIALPIRYSPKARQLAPTQEPPLRVALSCPEPPSGRIAVCGNGLVHTLEAAYSHHHHLTLRPDDVWLAVLSQFSIYVNKNAESLRSYFVTHEGKKEWALLSQYPLRFQADRIPLHIDLWLPLMVPSTLWISARWLVRWALSSKSMSKTPICDHGSSPPSPPPRFTTRPSLPS